jgi:uncharacterized damage-inducible protein DinB
MSHFDLAEEIRKNACLRLQENLDKILQCLIYFDDQSIWERSNENSLSIANQLLHLSGNITQYILSGLGKSLDYRNRDAEFSVRSGFKKSTLVDKFSTVVKNATSLIENCSADDLLQIRAVQGFELSGTGIIIHVVEHMSYHTGQIVSHTKKIIDRPMGFYDSVDLNIKNV